MRRLRHANDDRRYQPSLSDTEDFNMVEEGFNFEASHDIGRVALTNACRHDRSGEDMEWRQSSQSNIVVRQVVCATERSLGDMEIVREKSGLGKSGSSAGGRVLNHSRAWIGDFYPVFLSVFKNFVPGPNVVMIVGGVNVKGEDLGLVKANLCRSCECRLQELWLDD